MDSQGTRDAFERSIGDVLADLFEDGKTLIQQEIDLAKAEMSEKVSRLVRDGMGVMVGGVLAVVGVLALVAAAILGLALVLPAWAAALIVGGALLLIGAIIAMASIRAMRETGLAPSKTMETLRDDAKMVREKFA